MPEAAREVSQEYWRPANVDHAERIIKPLTTESLCPHCETEYSLEARFCHVCGEPRDRRPTLPLQTDIAHLLDMEVIRQRLGLSVASLVFLIIGLACFAGALLTGFVYRASTVLDWQAVQTWRIQWLLASIAAMLAGILLKKKT
jgi:hypothetical protein